MSDDKFEIDIQAFAKALQSGQGLNGKDGLLTPLIKQITEAALGAEIEQHLEAEPDNRKNGKGSVQISVSFL
ncbi:hypothetical protein VSP9026_00292 [Vibrio spartinae]|uniref:Mutator family transposase n=1 Tax=Vibrio spartinae TaxID=1918945 RepID=A0A1N6LZR3_9VIBR|nr:hypothetical protein VSP9026_00292 [Vibrio spartinae]